MKDLRGHISTVIVLVCLVLLVSAALCVQEVFAQATLVHAYPPGWNMISLPLFPDETDATLVLKGTSTPLYFYGYNDGKVLLAGEQGFPEVKPGAGNWLLLSTTTTVRISGAAADLASPYDLSIVRGWNIISTPWLTRTQWSGSRLMIQVRQGNDIPVSLGNAITNQWIGSQLFNYNPATDTYRTINQNGFLDPWQSYLLYSNIDGGVIFNVPPTESEFPWAEIKTPESDDEITTNTAVVGSATDANLVQYSLEYAPFGTDSYTVVASGSSNIIDATLGTLNPLLMLNGLSTLRLSAVDKSGLTTTDTINVIVRSDKKVGNFTMDLIDLEVPVPGMPIQIVRSYDSRDKTKGDFGVGWKLKMSNAHVQTNGPLGTGWNGQRAGSGGFYTYYILESRKHTLTVKLSEEKTHTFRTVLAGAVSKYSPIGFSTVSIAPEPRSLGTLEVNGDTDVMISTTSYPSELELFDYDGEDYNPLDYKYTTREKTELYINTVRGLDKIVDPDGNTLTFTPGGIMHSAGRSVVFTRDPDGRITSVTDPDGKFLYYGYDTHGNLVTVTDQNGRVIRYTYNADHGLTDIYDPLGRRSTRNEYDDQGRLMAHIDAKGNRVEFSRDVIGRQEVVQDAMGNITVYEYDERGNILSKTDSQARTTRFTYDANNNKTSETDPSGKKWTYVYDDFGNLLSETDPDGHTTGHTYNERGDELVVTDANGNVTEKTYDDAGHLLTVTDPLGNVTSYTYDDQGNTLSSTDPSGNTQIFAYDSAGNKVLETDANGNATNFSYDDGGRLTTEAKSRTTANGQETLVTSFEYDQNGQVTKTIDPEGNSTQREYDTMGNLTAFVDGKGNALEMQYDEMGNKTGVVDPGGDKSEFTYSPNGLVTEVSGDMGGRVYGEYDPAGRPTKGTDARGAVLNQIYDGNGRLMRVEGPSGTIEERAYDAAGNVICVTDQLGNAALKVYDAVGNVTATTDPNGNTTRYELDGKNRVTKTIYPDGTFTAQEYDCCMHVAAKRDQAGLVTRFAYDALGNVISVTDALGGITTRAYDEIGNLLTQTDANGHTQKWEYNKNGKMTKHTLPMGMSETFSYDELGKMASTTDFNGQTIQLDYDAKQRLANKKYPDGSEITIGYGATPRPLEVTDARGTTRFTYDPNNHPLSVTNPDGSYINYTYNLRSDILSIETAHGATNYTYDAKGRLLTVTDSDNQVTSFKYDKAGNRIEVSYPNNTKTTYKHDKLNRLTYLKTINPSGGIIYSVTYTLGLAGNRLRALENGGRIVDYSYDNLYRLTQEKIVDSANGNNTISYTYDAVGNRLTKTDKLGLTNYTYDDNDRLITEAGPSGTINYAYDNNGNLTTRTQGATVSQYTYDYDNRLISTQTGVVVSTFQYDWDGFLTSSTTQGQTVRYLVDRQRQFPQVLEETNTSAGLIASYVYGDGLISQKRGAALSIYHHDGIMSIRALTGAAGQVTDKYTYDAFGVQLARTGTTVNAYQFAGEPYNPNLGFYYLRARYLDPRIGRFISYDTAEGSIFEPVTLHKYVYAGNNPVNNIDPSGHDFFALPSLASVMFTMAITLVICAIVFYPTTGVGLTMLLSPFLLTKPSAERAILSKYQKDNDRNVYGRIQAMSTYWGKWYKVNEHKMAFIWTFYEGYGENAKWPCADHAAAVYACFNSKIGPDFSIVTYTAVDWVHTFAAAKLNTNLGRFDINMDSWSYGENAPWYPSSSFLYTTPADIQGAHPPGNNYCPAW